MKIALITIHKVTNYGAILQAYAARVALSKYGDVKTIDYKNEHLDSHMNLLRFKFSVHGFKMLAHDLLNLSNRSKVLSRFNSFIKLNMNLTKQINADQLEKGELEDFEVYVCGSDQIWNPVVVSSNKTIDPIFFLSFVHENKKKFSLASSIGHHQYSKNEKAEVKELLSGFNNISVRENDGQKKIKEIFPERDIYHVLDPTLLLSKKEWYSNFNIKEEEQKYILVYSVPRTELIKKAIIFFSQKLKLKVITIDRMLMPITKVHKQIRTAGPEEFIQLYANASFVITDSFHGTCFAVNFEKPFACISANERANRQESLLNLLGIKERLMYKEEDFINLTTELNYDFITKKLEKARQESLDYIQLAIGN
ncbi:polysaccharide pyruvyl transferase family protein [Cellulophaga fucicola]|uniref:polysaccharide pyruvyl transferase family protein n=1 Tax=Cellulophaga fucicola TaxID=76595 RepID=UPI003EBC63F5